MIGGWIPKGVDPSAEVVRPRVRAARRKLGRAALPAAGPRAAGAAAVVGDRIVVVGGQADDRLVDTTEVFDGKQWSAGANIPTPREHLAAVSDGRLPLRGRRAQPLPRQELRGARALRPRRRPLATARPTCPPPAAASEPRSPPAICSRSAARPRRAHWARSSPTTSRARPGPARPSMRTPRHGIAVAAIGRSLYALGGAPRPGHASAIGDRGGHQAGARSVASARRHLAPPPPDANPTPEHGGHGARRDDLGRGRTRQPVRRARGRSRAMTR